MSKVIIELSAVIPGRGRVVYSVGLTEGVEAIVDAGDARVPVLHVRLVELSVDDECGETRTDDRGDCFGRVRPYKVTHGVLDRAPGARLLMCASHAQQAGARHEITRVIA